jgi:hypothetical protein
VAQTEAVLARARAALQIADVRLVSQGSPSLSLGFAIREAELGAAMEALHREFFTAPDGHVFAAPEYVAVRTPQPASAARQRRPSGQPERPEAMHIVYIGN